MVHPVQLSPGLAIDMVMKRFGCSREAAYDFIEFYHGDESMPGVWEHYGIDEMALDESLGLVETRTLTAEQYAAEQEAKKSATGSPPKGKGGRPPGPYWAVIFKVFADMVVSGTCSEVFDRCKEELKARLGGVEVSDTALDAYLKGAHRVFKEANMLKCEIAVAE